MSVSSGARPPADVPHEAHPLPRVRVVGDRHAFVVERCRGRRVLHLGCVDAGVLEDRFRRGELLHQKLAAVASELWGSDVDEAGIDFLRAQGFDRLLAADGCRPGAFDALARERFDVVVACEILEHLANPGLFLDNVRGLVEPGRTELIVSVPNAFRFTNLRWLVRRRELVHPDHNYWFSYVTLRHLLSSAGLRVNELLVYQLEEPWLLRRPFRPYVFLRRLPGTLAKRWLMHRTPFFADGLVALCDVPA